MAVALAKQFAVLNAREAGHWNLTGRSGGRTRLRQVRGSSLPLMIDAEDVRYYNGAN